MQLNHANLAVDDVAATVDFFRQFLGFTVLVNKNDAFAVLDDGHGFVFNLMVAGKGEVVSYSRNFVATRYFYENVLASLGKRITHQGEGWFQADELFIDGAAALNHISPAALPARSPHGDRS